MKKNIEKELYKIAAFNSWEIENRGDLKAHADEKENSIELSVSAIQAMLAQAFELGRKAAEAETKSNADLKNEIFRKACNGYYTQHSEAK